MNKLSATQRAYIAGLIDGDGSISLTKNKSLGMLHRYNFYISIRIFNTSVYLMDSLSLMLGVHYTKNKFTKESYNKKVLYQITINKSKDASDLIQQIRPYLILKRGQAEVAIKFLKLKNRTFHRPKSIHVFNRMNGLHSDMLLVKKV